MISSKKNKIHEKRCKHIDPFKDQALDRIAIRF
jgi:hypothetical protein